MFKNLQYIFNTKGVRHLSQNAKYFNNVTLFINKLYVKKPVPC